MPSIQLVTGGESIKTNNLRKGVFGYATIFFKQFFKERFDLNLDKFNCEEVLGVGIGHMRSVLNLEIYQILWYYPENINIIINTPLHPKYDKNEKFIYIYFMARTYEELYNRYISEEINFPIIKNGTLRICQFITLKKVFQQKKEKLKKKNKSDELVETTIK